MKVYYNFDNKKNLKIIFKVKENSFFHFNGERIVNLDSKQVNSFKEFVPHEYLFNMELKKYMLSTVEEDIIKIKNIIKKLNNIDTNFYHKFDISYNKNLDWNYSFLNHLKINEFERFIPLLKDFQNQLKKIEKKGK